MNYLEMCVLEEDDLEVSPPTPTPLFPYLPTPGTSKRWDHRHAPRLMYEVPAVYWTLCTPGEHSVNWTVWHSQVSQVTSIRPGWSVEGFLCLCLASPWRSQWWLSLSQGLSPLHPHTPGWGGSESKEPGHLTFMKACITSRVATCKFKVRLEPQQEHFILWDTVLSGTHTFENSRGERNGSISQNHVEPADELFLVSKVKSLPERESWLGSSAPFFIARFLCLNSLSRPRCSSPQTGWKSKGSSFSYCE